MTEIVRAQELSPSYVVDVTKPFHIAWWAAAFDVPERTLIEAVELVGPRATEVFRYLQRYVAQPADRNGPQHVSDRRQSDRRGADRRATTVGLPDEVVAGEAQHETEQR